LPKDSLGARLVGGAALACFATASARGGATSSHKAAITRSAISRVLGSQFTPEDNARGVRLALAEAISSGITTVHNWSHNLLTPAYADAELAVHHEVGGARASPMAIHATPRPTRRCRLTTSRACSDSISVVRVS
jgi:hypothetical protein